MSSPLEGEESRKTHKNVRRRPRATSACLDCRRRKVRCDVVLRRPCSNCQLDEYDCQVMARRPKRYVEYNGPDDLRSIWPVLLRMLSIKYSNTSCHIEQGPAALARSKVMGPILPYPRFWSKTIPHRHQRQDCQAVPKSNKKKMTRRLSQQPLGLQDASDLSMTTYRSWRQRCPFSKTTAS